MVFLSELRLEFLDRLAVFFTLLLDRFFLLFLLVGALETGVFLALYLLRV